MPARVFLVSVGPPPETFGAIVLVATVIWLREKPASAVVPPARFHALLEVPRTPVGRA